MTLVEALFARLSNFLLGDEPGVLICMWQRVCRWPQGRSRSYSEAPKIAEIVGRVNADPRLAEVVGDALPLHEGWEG